MNFSTTLKELRIKNGFTNERLAQVAHVPESLISGLQNGKRRVGELQARKLGKALNLRGAQLERFVYAAIDTCTEKVLKELRRYPARILNHLAVQLSRSGIAADSIQGVAAATDEGDKEITLSLKNGKQATVQTLLVLQ